MDFYHELALTFMQKKKILFPSQRKRKGEKSKRSGEVWGGKRVKMATEVTFFHKDISLANCKPKGIQHSVRLYF